MLLRFIFIALGLGMLSGCGVQQLQHNPDYAPVRPHAVIRDTGYDGAIYQQQSAVLLFETPKARNIGDILTVVFDEKTTGKKETKTEDNKGSGIELLNPTIFGKAVATDPVSGDAIGNALGKFLNTSIESESDFKSKGKSEQKNSLTGSVGVAVVDVLPNGNLVVRGEKLVTINQGDEYVQLSGIVRQVDIGNDNIVPSSKIANARITYSGVGLTHDSNKAGWGSRFFLGDMWPF